MKLSFRVLTSVGLIGAATIGSADFFNFSISGGSLTDAPAGNTQSVNTAGASGVIRGYTIKGDWVAGGGDPFSSEFLSQLSGVGDAGGGDLDRFHGGADDGNDFSFGTATPTWESGLTSPEGRNQGGFVSLSAPSLGGSFNLNLYQSFAGSDATLSNASIQFYTDAVAPTAITTVGQGTMTNRPTSFSGTSTGSFRYVATTFVPQVTGEFLIGLHTNGTDGFLLAYNGAFNPASTLTNIIGTDDVGDLGDSNSSNMMLTLTAGNTYTFVSTVFTATSDISGGTLIIAGPTAPVPEPATLAALGLGLAAIARKRRKAQ